LRENDLRVKWGEILMATAYLGDTD
jgi:hypothetical protein